MEKDLKIEQGLIIKGALVILILVLLFMINPFIVIGAGEAGVVISKISGVKKEFLGEGLHFVIPVIVFIQIYIRAVHTILRGL